MSISAAIKNIFTSASSKPKFVAATSAQPPASPEPTTSAVVIPLHRQAAGSTAPSVESDTRNSLSDAQSDGLDRALQQDEKTRAEGVRFYGVLDYKEIKDYLGQNFFGFGRHNGSRYQTNQALRTGRDAVVANFIVILESLAERHEAKHAEIQVKQDVFRNLAPELAARLDLSLRHNSRVINLLEKQIAAARSGQGWIAAALSEYESGFTRGVHDSIDFDHING